jgi:hypothetical protein
MQLLTAIVTAMSAIVGVAADALISARSHQRSQEVASQVALHRDKQAACVELPAACRVFRRHVMFSDMRGEAIPPDDDSKGAIAIDDIVEYRPQWTLHSPKVMIVAGSDWITAAGSRALKGTAPLSLYSNRKGKRQNTHCGCRGIEA